MAKRRGGRGGATAPFLYETVATELLRRIVDGAYPPGYRIPTEAELVAEFRVSAITVRRAVRDLMRSGVLSGHQGRGVFVADTRRIVRRFSDSPRTATADDIQRSGYQPGMKERSLALVAAPADVAERLGLPPGTLVYRHDKIMLADGEPVALDTTFFPSSLGDRVRHDLSQDFLFTVLAQHDVPIDHLDYRFEASAIEHEDARALALPPGSAVLSVCYTAFGPAGATIVTGRTVSRSDRFAYEFCGRPATHVESRPD